MNIPGATDPSQPVVPPAAQPSPLPPVAQPDEVQPIKTAPAGTPVGEKKTWIERYGSFAAAVCSLFVAGTSLWVAISALKVSTKQQQHDTAHKELLIKPFLFSRADELSMAAAIVNSGLGPADIKRVAIAFDNSCYDSRGLDETKWREQISDARPKLDRFLYNDSAAALRAANQSLLSYVGLPYPGELIPVGGSVSIAALRTPAQPIPIPTPEHTKASKIFSEKLLQTTILIEYCSMTGRSCHNLRYGTVPCEKK
ncbi:hypothetical protein AB4Z10_13390 [Bosea sp. RAF48]|uniref:hypothetical protein n=1 Tax=Bosea sp. RAF48 TaxID=3237480 RepID=UPI003F918980